MPPDTIEAIERATLAAVPPDSVEELGGWLLALDGGTVGRAHSAVPLRHTAPDPALLPQIEARYRAHGLAPVFRLPAVAEFEAFVGAMRERGYAEAKPTLVMLGTSDGMARAAAAQDVQGVQDVELADAPGDDWAQVFLGEGFDAVDGASRVRLLRRARDAAYASLREPVDGGDVAAVGCACFSHALVGVHGMRTRPALRGRGLARRLLAAMGQAAMARGIRTAFLQVEVDNPAVHALYARCGFAPAWRYGYWLQR